MSQSFNKIQVAQAYQLVFDAIEQQIMDGQLRPGDKLPTETALANQFGVNRSTVREGIRLLEHSGLVQRRDGRRLFVALPHYSELAPGLARAFILQGVTFRELWETSIVQEPQTAMLAARYRQDEIIEALEDNLARTRRAIDNGEGVVELDVEFHHLIGEATNNKVMMLAREPISQLLFPSLSEVFRRNKTDKPKERLYEAHRHMLDAIRAQNEEAAKLWATRHIEDFWRAFQVNSIDVDSAIVDMTISG